ncbi:ubiquitin-protein ligase [Lentinula edodes]|uniref:Ubiquitin-protein ligase n=1 Tax=Lentinula edodes TaxID=5353 RepID=A0A1Q3E5Y4_LENED|nr:ubiquitin-protein ligase [Lentinula edodes]
MKHILESVVKVFELCGSSSSVLEVKYLEEVEACLGPTSRLYALVSEEFEVSKIWRDSGHGTPGAEASPFVHHESGLYPVPIGAEDMGGLRLRLKLVLGEEVSLTSATLKLGQYPFEAITIAPDRL